MASMMRCTCSASAPEASIWSGGDLVDVLLHPLADAAGERFAEIHHPAQVVKGLSLARKARVEVQVFAGILQHKARLRANDLQRFQAIAAPGIITARQVAENAILEQQVDLDVRPAHARPSGPSTAARA